MKTIILAAGYATRLYPLTQNFPKPLLDVQGISILDRLLQDLEGIEEIDEHIIVSNAKFYNIFSDWKKDACTRYSKKLTLLNDGSTENDNRLGAVKDILFALKETCLNDDIFVLAGDNVLDFSLKEFVKYFYTKKSSCIMRHEEKCLEKLQRTGVIQIDADEKVVLMQEKPVKPCSCWAVPPFYIYPKEMLEAFEQGIEEGCSTDAPGDFISWFCSSHTVHAWLMKGQRYDVGNMESYEFVKHALLHLS